MYLGKMTTAQAKEAFQKDSVRVIPAAQNSMVPSVRSGRTIWYRRIWQTMWLTWKM
mgnify:CR=1 FL=1